jgi:hypothetical protein
MLQRDRPLAPSDIWKAERRRSGMKDRDAAKGEGIKGALRSAALLHELSRGGEIQPLWPNFRYSSQAHFGPWNSP